ncbi:polysaccharide deacetylase family protein [Paenibacillus mendelii]|uniref:Polysaccharide deacetylase family protein n=1 Tax=Paenibacillus mendelii TaxID=206163 RepID=A0ABV6JGE1_9BACL|nr:polysaccharide deacetylase family protein [Paenibacillus mendelii]MCQ6557867.1 polysaccharide deacetylase family protein [Paenibacillus mendelii]
MRLKKVIAMVAIMGALLLAVRLNGDLSGYVDVMKSGRTMDTFSASLLSGNEDQALRLRIEEEAAKRRIAPIDARVDRVWKAIPGYNGLEVDVNKTYMHMRKASPQAPIQYVFNEIKPKIGLDDLGTEPIYKGNPEKPMVALMINVAWGNEFLEPMLKTLKQENVKATFFFDGSWLKKNADAARVIQSYGHELSNHAYSHPDMSKLDRTSQYNQIAKTEALLKSTLGVSNRFFAPPSGDFNRMTVEVAAEQGLKTVLWTLDTVDWMHPSPDSIVRKISTRVEPGSLILMHPTDSASGALLGMIKAIKQKGLVLGTVSETLSSDRVRLVEAGL